MKNLHKKFEKELNHEIQPTEFETINIDKGQFVVRGKEVEMNDIIDDEVEIFKENPSILRSICKNDLDMHIR
jgi:hypothetical protein